MVFAVSLGAIAVAALMLWGWGSAFQRAFTLERQSWPATAAVGMAAVVCLGGVLNLARLAVPWALAMVVAMGVFLALRERIFFEMPPFPTALLIAAIIIFTIATQLPPGMYNGHDDFQKYFAYPVRMLDTGTVFGSPLSAMGTQTLGAQAFLDAFVVALFPIAYINGVDAVFGLFLCLSLAGCLLKKRGADRCKAAAGGSGLSWLFTPAAGPQLLCVASVVLIDPQYANISTLYCGSALIMALTVVPGVAAAGLIYAALIAMKPTFVVFVAMHFLATLRSLREASRTALATAGFLLPWVLVHAPNYLAGLRPRIPSPVPGNVLKDSLNLFSFAPLEYGASAGSFTLLVAAMGICATRERKAVTLCASGIATFFVLIYVLGPLHAGYEQSLRYYAPVAIGLAPAIVGFSAGSRFAMIAVCVALAAFSPSLWTRAESAWRNHSVWSYARSTADQDYRDYMQRVLKGRERETVEAIQGRVPPGETVLAWINAPFYLNYKRNPIIDIDPAGIGNAWARLPAARYLIWDYDGFATRDEEWYRRQTLDVGAGERRNSALSLDFLKKMEAMVAAGEVVYDNGEVKVVRLGL